MAQRDYVSCGRSDTRRKKTISRRNVSSSYLYNFMIILAFSILVTFAGLLYFIANNKPAELPALPRSITNNGNGLPPKPEERWRYIKELENRQLDVPELIAPSSGEIKSPVQLTQEQRQLLEQMQADMRRAPTQLSEAPYNNQTPVSRSHVTISAPKTVVILPVVTTSTVTQPPASTRAPVTVSITQTTTTPKQETPKPVETAKRPEAPKPEKAQHWVVQCGSFKTLDSAESVRAQLAFAGIESRIASSSGWNRITLELYKDRDTINIDKILSRLKDAGVANCIPLAAGG
ncbi:MAG: cell division protein FtsN [Symbiopectobacterium sp.]